ncbi:MAG: hypothetical protein JWP10_665 [Nocardioidaceae bacterium]|nr:hypothetical protein [Nocardioidaceae bacterium]
MNRTRRPLTARAVPVAVVCAVIAAAFYVQTAHAQTTEPDAPTATQPAGEPALSINPLPVLAATELSQGTLRSLVENGTVLVVGDPASSHPAITEAEALQVASGSFSFTSRRQPSESAYGSLTLLHYGRETEPDTTKPSKIVPIIADRPVWFFVFRGVEMQIFGPYRSDEDAAKAPTTYPGSIWVAVDATTGKSLGGESVDY